MIEGMRGGRADDGARRRLGTWPVLSQRTMHVCRRRRRRRRRRRVQGLVRRA